MATGVATNTRNRHANVARICGREIWLKRGFASLIPMIRTILELPSVVADYTVGTVIVFVQLTRWKRDRRLRIAA